MLPWVRMHAAKDYADMPAILEEYPHVKQNFNLTPVLLEQILDLGRGGRDELVRIAHRGGDDWSLEERKYLIRQCFMANRNRQIKPLPRYEELYVRIVENPERSDWTIMSLTPQDYRDLIVLFHLAWMDPRWFVRHPELDALRAKERGFSAMDVEKVMAIQIGIANEAIPLYRRLAERGQIELSTSPFFHPIGPLLLDHGAALEANPEIELPRDGFDGREDLVWQIEAAKRLHEETFGKPPAGIWPPECGVSPGMAQVAAGCGFDWMMADQSCLRDRGPDDHYLTWSYQSDNTSLRILLRDTLLSDLIGFTYANWEPASAAADLVGRILSIGSARDYGDIPPAVVIALDGENAWENYDSDGVPFLHAFYGLLGQEPRIECCTAGEYIAKYHAAGSLHRLGPGSWIGGNFDVWIGSAQDRAAWEAIAHARAALMKARTRIGAAARLEAWKRLMAAEGSDWTWWYGREYDSPERPAFDELFRAHIAAVYEIIGERIPENIKSPL